MGKDILPDGAELVLLGIGEQCRRNIEAHGEAYTKKMQTLTLRICELLATDKQLTMDEVVSLLTYAAAVNIKITIEKGPDIVKRMVRDN